jgi:hypothetical protein
MISGSSLLLYKFTRKAIKLAIAVIVGTVLSTSYKIIFLSRLRPQVDEISMDHQCWFQCNRSTTAQILFHSFDSWGGGMGLKWDCTSAIPRLQDNLCFIWDGSIV